MRPQSVTLTAVGTSQALPADHYITPFNIGLGLVISGGTPSVSVQHTFDDIFNASVTPTWFNHPSMNAVTASVDGNYAFPVRAVRLNYGAGPGTAVLTIIQAGRG